MNRINGNWISETQYRTYMRQTKKILYYKKPQRYGRYDNQKYEKGSLVKWWSERSHGWKMHIKQYCLKKTGITKGAWQKWWEDFWKKKRPREYVKVYDKTFFEECKDC